MGAIINETTAATNGNVTELVGSAENSIPNPVPIPFHCCARPQRPGKFPSRKALLSTFYCCLGPHIS